MSKLSKLGFVLGAASLTLGAVGGAAWAGGNGAQTSTAHAHGADAAGLEVVDFNPNSQNTPPGVVLPAGCWLTDTEAIVSTDGNAIMHTTGNKTGFWLTSTYTGGAVVLPLVLKDGNPISDSQGNDEVDTSAAPIATGHMTTWFGSEDNNQNGVMHGTLTFHGTDSSGNPADIDGHFQFAMNANGQPTAMVATVSC